MAEIQITDANQNPQKVQTEEEKLKYLEFVQIATFHTVLYALKAYSYAKDNSGPLKNGVQTVEGTVKTVVAPVYDKYHDVPIELLKLVDRKVDESVHKLDSRVPLSVKLLSTRALSAAQNAPATARSVVSEVKGVSLVGTVSGLAKTAYATYEPAAKGLYSKYEPVAEQYAASTWRSLNQLPLFPQVAQVVVPTAAYCSEKYNETVQRTAEQGYKISSYLPLVPTKKIAEVFSGSDAQTETVDPSAGAGAVSN
ncbi:hypothetical protein DCAR_0624009 [Daucus carota subsp. sativus]|uniref:Small rubber particle protein n=1 Tax=Daucus carota subsp. sativus TaxID=79200 RepID=A0AAF1B4R5_DAUCS|nr:PREDICTED: REF/SRPP-like protein At3g05500 [Daucus carota subsp. sativus]XP_017254614.1 PREDICTED: REF/SRPP-like protein At3g05500 [Daucus carota subsp. sativus]WOH04598.1 hypothetical protein DCAR_0624009 [Daucus carota subsp. sativus]